MTNYKLLQTATSLTPDIAKTLVLGATKLYDNIILVQLPDFWVRLDTDSNTYAVGDYEG